MMRRCETSDIRFKSGKKFHRIHFKQLRTEKGLSQDQLAALLGISRSAVGMYETGKREPDLETCEAIADIFNIDMDYLTGRSDIERQAEAYDAYMKSEAAKMHLTITDADPQLEELTRNAQQLNAQGLQKLVDISDDMVASGKYRKAPLHTGEDDSGT